MSSEVYTISMMDIGNLFSKAGISLRDFKFLDSVYACPSKIWIEKTFAPAFENFKKVTGEEEKKRRKSLPGYYQEEQNDCDDYALDAQYYAHRLNRRTLREQKCALAFGVFYYTTEEMINHAINVFVYFWNKELKIGFFEPQAAKIVELTGWEIQSCFGGNL